MKTSLKWIDAACILLVTIVYWWTQHLPEAYLSNFWLFLFTSLFFVVGICTANRIKSFAFVVVVSIAIYLAGFAVSLVLQGSSLGYVIFPAMLIIKYTLAPVLAGYALSLLYTKAASRFLTSRPLEQRFRIAVSTLIVAGWGIDSSFAMTGKVLLEREIQKRSLIAEAIFDLFLEGKLTNQNDWTSLTNGILSDVYGQSNTDIYQHGYGGQIKLQRNHPDIEIIYEDIPAGTVCHWFYFINSPNYYGFDDTYVDGVHTSGSRNAQEQTKLDQQLCYSGKKRVTVTYVATPAAMERSKRHRPK